MLKPDPVLFLQLFTFPQPHSDGLPLSVLVQCTLPVWLSMSHINRLTEGSEDSDRLSLSVGDLSVRQRLISALSSGTYSPFIADLSLSIHVEVLPYSCYESASQEYYSATLWI